MPDTGNQRRFTEKSRIIIMPRKKDGIEMPSSTTKVITLSAVPYWFAAETTPAITPRMEQITKAVPASTSVPLNRSSTSSRTGRLSAKLCPKSPVSMLPSQMKYCCTRGLSRPRSRVSRATFSGVA